MKKKIRILRIIARLNTGGPALHVALLESLIDRSDFETLLYTGKVSPGEGTDLQHAADEKNIDIVYNPFLERSIRPLADFIVFLQLFWLIFRYRPMVVHTHTAKAGFIGRLAAVLNGVPLIFHTYHGHVFSGYFSPLKTRLFICIDQVLACFTTRLITLSDRLLNELSEKYRIAPVEKFIRIPLGFTFDNLSITQSRDSVRAQYGISGDTILMGIVARLTAIKNHSMLLKAFRRTLDRIEQPVKLKLWIIGDGELADEIKSEVRKLHLEDQVLFMGWQLELGNLYQAMDLVLLSSSNEGLPVTLIEGLAMGKKILSTDVGGVRDLVEEDSDGLIVSPENVEAYSEAMIRLIEAGNFRLDPERQQTIREKYSAHRLVHDIESLYYSELRYRLGSLK